jgi:hypothetical protein
MATSNQDIPTLKRTFARRNLDRLSEHEPPSVPDEPVGDPCDLALDLLKKWSHQYNNEQTINFAIGQQVFGGKNEIDFRLAFLAFMESTGVYLRDWGRHVHAWKTYRDFKQGGKNDPSKEQEAVEAYMDAYAPIEQLAKYWGLDFLCLTDLVTKSPDGHPFWDGPFCGAFFTTAAQTKPFIGVAFKGTNPLQIREDLVDLNYELQPAAPYLDDVSVSTGVFTGLFKTFSSYGVPYDIILGHLKELAPKLPNVRGPVRTHVTGHSLGGSYSSLCYAQLLIDVLPAGSEIVMGDEYTFGSPRVGNEMWAANCVRLVDVQPGSSWRIVNNEDIVPQVPPTELMPSQVDFYHVNNGYQIFSKKSPVPIPSEIGGPPPPVYQLRSLRDLIEAVRDSVYHRELKSSVVLVIPADHLHSPYWAKRLLPRYGLRLPKSQVKWNHGKYSRNYRVRLSSKEK